MPRYFYLITAIFLGAVFLLALHSIADYDTGYHLATGQYIVTHKAVPLYDIFSYTASGARWIAHYWLADVIFYLVYQLTGYWGLIVFVALMAALTYYFILKTAWLKKGKSLLPLVLLMVLAYLSMGLWVARPQIFSYFFVVLLIYLLEYRRKFSDDKLLWALPPLFLIWANMHAGVVLGIAVAALYFTCEIISSRFELKKIKLLAAVFAVLSAVVLANPNGYKVVVYNWIITPAVKLMQVEEWKPLLDFWYRWQTKAFLAILVVSLAFVWWMVLKKRDSFYFRDWISLGLVSGAALMSLISVRHVGFFPIISLPIVSAYLSGLLEEKKTPFDSVRFVMPLAFVLGIILMLGPLLRLPKIEQINNQQLPEDSTNFILKNNLPAPILNPQRFGGYFIWKLWPKYRVFVDGRSEVFMGAPNDDYGAIFLKYPGWEKIINEKYKIETIVLSYPDFANIIGKKNYDSITGLGFVLVYFDDLSAVLVRNDAQNRELIDKFGYQVIVPFFETEKIPKDSLSSALKEAQRAFRDSPDSLITRSLLEAVKIRAAQESITL